METENKMNFEQALETLEKIVKELESGDVPLDMAIQKYTEAMELVKFCDKALDDATEQVSKIMNADGSLSDFKVDVDGKESE